MSYDPKKGLMIHGMHGLGDNIYQRAFVKQFPGAYLETSWPELYQDLDIHVVRPSTRLRTQAKNVVASEARWEVPPAGLPSIKVGYNHADLLHGTIIQKMSSLFKVQPAEFDLPDFGKSPIQVAKPVAIIRPVTVRREWFNSARGPNPTYINMAAQELRQRGYHVVSIADLKPDEEWSVGELPAADEVYHHGELSVTQMLAAIQNADVVVGGVGWIVPACIASKTPLFTILGGNGRHNAPEKITHPSMDLSLVGWAKPDRFCLCTNPRHYCAKGISGFQYKFSSWLDRQGLHGTRNFGAGLAA